MAELLVFMVNVTSDKSIYADAKLPKRGDVITAQEDGWPWGTSELGDPCWRIIKLPGLKVSDVSMLLSPEIGAAPDPKLGDPLQDTLQYRGFHLDVTKVISEPELTAYLDTEAIVVKDGAAKRPDPFYEIKDPAAFTEAITKREPILNPRVIGDLAKVIG